jgi:protein-L-isoaspartate(D-aspartate) O-methyltransferase
MLEALEITKNHRVLEVGTGSGYQTALLADLVGHVYSIERLPGLILKARKVLRQLAYKNITLKLGDGTEGWPQQAPFHAIVVSAASPSVPHPYLDQLVEGGRMVVPVGDEHSQELTLITKNKGRINKRILSGCRFVKLKGKYGFQAS